MLATISRFPKLVVLDHPDCREKEAMIKKMFEAARDTLFLVPSDSEEFRTTATGNVMRLSSDPQKASSQAWLTIGAFCMQQSTCIFTENEESYRQVIGDVLDVDLSFAHEIQQLVDFLRPKQAYSSPILEESKKPKESVIAMTKENTESVSTDTRQPRQSVSQKSETEDKQPSLESLIDAQSNLAKAHLALVEMVKQKQKLTEPQKTFKLKSPHIKTSELPFPMRSTSDQIQRVKREPFVLNTEATLTDASLDKLDVAIKTMRDLPIVGKLYKDQIDFRWPSPNDVRKMPKDKPFALSKVMWRRRMGGQILGAIQLQLANGESSPIFSSDKTPEIVELNACELNSALTVNQIEVQVARQHQIMQLQFLDDSGQLVASIETEDYGNWETRTLNPGEQIIGIYGVKGQHNFISSVGFTVWTPPNSA